MSTLPSPPVPEFGVRSIRPKTVHDFGAQLRDTHTTGVAMGATGPIVLLGAFLSSSAVLLYRGVRGAAFWIEQKVRRVQT